MENNNNFLKHPSFGMLQITRSSGGDNHFFGSSIKHNNYITFRIHEGLVKRNEYHQDQYSTGKKIIEIRMSNLQFAEAITNLSNGLGTPVTLSYINSKKIENYDFPENKRELFEQEFKEEILEIVNSLSVLSNSVTNILNDKTHKITQSERTDIANKINRIISNIGQNLPFVQTMFNEQVEKTITEMKNEFDAHIMQQIHNYGLEKINKDNKGIKEIEK